MSQIERNLKLANSFTDLNIAVTCIFLDAVQDFT